MGEESGRVTFAELTQLAEAVSGVTFTGSLGGTTLWVSPMITSLVGWTPEELVGHPFFEFLHPDDVEAAARARRGADERLPVRFRVRVLTKGGSYRWIDILLRTAFDDNGQPVELFGSWRDAEDDVQQREALEAALSRTRAMLDGMLDPWVLLEPVRDESGAIVDFVFAEANRRACEYNRLPREELLGASLLDLLPAHRGSHLFIAYVHLFDTGEPLILDDFAYPREIFDGAERCFDIRAVKVGDAMSYTWRDVTERYEDRARLERSENRLAAALESEIDPHVFLEAIRDSDGRIVDLRYEEINPAAATYLGASRDELRGTALSAQGSPAFASLMKVLSPVIDTGLPLAVDAWRITTLYGENRAIDVRAVKVGDAVSVIWRDVTELAHAREFIAQSEERFRLLAENSSDVILRSRNGLMLWVSPSLRDVLGWAPEDWVGQNLYEFLDKGDHARLLEAAKRVSNGETVHARYRLLSKSGEYHWVDTSAGRYIDASGSADGVVSSFHLADEQVRTEVELERRARYDLLTGLMNRSELLHTVGRLSTQRTRTGELTAMLFCDIDLFKDINNEHGHAAGDEVLRTLGKLLASTISADDYAARIGGDEFLVVLTGVRDLDEATSIAEKVRAAAAKPIALEHGVRITPTLSIGVTLARPGETTDQLVARADNAMYDAKRGGRNRIIAIA